MKVEIDIEIFLFLPFFLPQFHLRNGELGQPHPPLTKSFREATQMSISYGGSEYALQPYDPKFRGVRISDTQKEAIFGKGRGGIFTSNDNEHLFIKAIFGQSMTYPNEFDGTKILYCYSPKKWLNSRMKNEYHATGRKIRILVGMNCEDYDCGFYFCTGFDTIEWHGEAQPRFILERCAEQDEQDEKDAAAPGTVVASIGNAENEGEGVPAAKRRRCAYSFEVNYDGVYFDSILEARHYVLMKEILGCNYQAQSVGSFNLGTLGDFSCNAYTPDGMLRDVLLLDSTTPTPLAVVEIKPRFPSDIEGQKCQRLSELFQWPVILFYGDMRPRFTKSAIDAHTGKRCYEHHDGLAGIIFLPDGSVIEGAMWCWDTDFDAPRFDARRGFFDKRCEHERIVEALASAGARQFTAGA